MSVLHFKCPFKFLLMLDFETTTNGANCDYPFEIIQFSVAVLEVVTNIQREDLSFNEYVRPVKNPVLTSCCTELTGITQKTLDQADDFVTVYNRFFQWLGINNFKEGEFAITSDCRQDMWRIAQYQFRLAGMKLPSFFRQYISLWKVFELEQERCGRKELFAKTYIGKMSEYYNIDIVGRPHNANDDCRMLILITQKMLQTGATISINEVLVCYSRRRRKPLSLGPGWRNSFRDTLKVFEWVMPLVVKPCQPSKYKPEDYGFCKYCRQPPEICGQIHKQFPFELYEAEADPIVFAELVNYHIK